MLPDMLQIFIFFLIWSHAKHFSCFKLYLDTLLLNFNVGAMVQWLLLIHNFIQQSLNSVSVEVQILLAAGQRFAMVRISDCGLARKLDLTPFVGQPFRKNSSIYQPFQFLQECHLKTLSLKTVSN